MRCLEEVEAAEARMNAAKDALLKYVEGRKTLDPEEYRRLVARVKKTEAEFMDASTHLGE